MTRPHNTFWVFLNFIRETSSIIMYSRYLRSRGGNSVQIFFKFGTDIPFCNSLDKFDGQKIQLYLPTVGGGGYPQFSCLVPQKVLLEKILTVEHILQKLF